jgi:glycosyltransferase involved in cell wall biosynthesis
MNMHNKKRTLKITHIVDYLMPAMGYQEFLLPKWNARHGHDVHIITSDRYTPVHNYEETWGQMLGPRKCGASIQQIERVTIHRIPCLWEFKARPWLLGLERKISQLSPDVIFCHGTASPSAFRVAALVRRRGIALLMDNHMIRAAQNLSATGRIYYMFLKILSRNILDGAVHRFLGVGQECCDFMQEEQNLRKDLIECLPLGVDTEIFRPDEAARERFRRKYDIPLSAKVILQTGKLSLDKGAHLLTQAVAKIMRHEPKVWLVLVGAGAADYVEKVRLPLLQGGVIGRLCNIPFVPLSELAGIYNMADVCVYPGATSLSCLEAAACGRAVIMTDLPISKWRADQGVGICYPTGQVDALREHIEDLLKNPERRKAVGERARASILSSFSYESIAHRAEKLMYEAIATKSTQRANSPTLV